ncbi:MAG: diguanylate cyclase [Gammaproteobacteria bacterium]|nr:diguanylate cyclase [Gammaproteobacteria bacterium]
MIHELFEKLSTTEIDNYVGELERAVESHIIWLSRINSTLITGVGLETIDTSDDAHLKCQFGLWHQKFTDIESSTNPFFYTIFEIHRELHQEATHLLTRHAAGEALTPKQYQALTSRSDLLRGVTRQLAILFRENMRIASSLINQVFEHTREGVVITDKNSVILSVNHAFCTITGYDISEVLGKRPSILASGRHDKEFYRMMWRELLLSGSWKGEIWNRRKNGEIFAEHLSISAVRDHKGEITHLVGITTDITAEKRYKSELYQLAHFDQLTHLHNRASLYQQLEQAILMARRNGYQIGVMYIDLDGFKQVNDTLGHTAGDQLLVNTAERLRECLRESDVVGRMGGDEFMIITNSAHDSLDIATIATKILSSLRRPHRIGGAECQVAASIGISIYPQHGETTEALILCADDAMYYAKNHGKDCFSFCISPALSANSE